LRTAGAFPGLRENATMLVYLVRHAIAVEREQFQGSDDSMRELTDKGMARMRQNLRGLARLKLHWDEIWSSPFLRAKQTADILAEYPGFEGRFRLIEPLRSGGDLVQVVSELQSHANLDAVALVGHEPDLGELATRLISGQTFSGVAFKKGGIACIAIETAATPLRGELQWLLTPKQMRALA
jgi:phosphohistidine phosphatase